MELGRAYAVLGLAPGAPGDDVRHAYRGAMRRHHPDTGSGNLAALARAGSAYRTIVAALPRPRGPVADPPRAHVDVYA